MTALQFPDGFRWGTATASFQIEGAADVDDKRPSIWDVFCEVPGAVEGGDDGRVAVDHYHRYREDVDLMAGLGFGTYRFSVSWPRVMDGDRVNEKGMDFYSRLVDALLERGVAPWLTLYHWDLPASLPGGWTNRDTALRFVDYALAVHERLGDRVGTWTTLNEPWCSAFLGHASGEHAPGRTDQAEAVVASHHLLLGHGLATEVLHGGRRPAEVGIVLNHYDVSPLTDSPADVDAARRLDGQQNRWWLDALYKGEYPADVVEDFAQWTDLSFVRDGDLETISTHLDWMGINYYSSFVVRGLDAPAPAGARPTPWIGCEDVEIVPNGEPVTAMGWDVVPSGLTKVLTRIDRDYDAPPLYVTENGAAYDDQVVVDGAVQDDDRIAYVDAHLSACLDAIDAGADLRGYFIWSLMDNFEWAWGYAKRFGVVHVDYDTLKRTPKASAHAYAALARENGWA